MKKFTSLMAVMAVLVMAVCFTACAPAEEAMYFIGATGPLNGETAIYGTSVFEGATIAIEEINANGGLNGVKFKFDMKDDSADPESAKNGFNTLYGNGMQASIGSVTSAACEAFAISANRERVFVLTPSASSEPVIAKGDQTFRMCFGDAQQAYIAADLLSEQYAKIGVIYDSSDTYSAGIFKDWETRMTELGKVKGTDYFVYSFDADNKVDFSSQVAGIQADACDVIFLPIYYTEAGLIAKAAAKISYNVPIFGCDGLDGVAGQLDDTVTASIKYITPFDVNSTDAKVVSFVNAYKAKYGKEPTQFAADGYDSIMAIFEAMKAAGVNDVNISAADLCQILVDTFTSESFSYTGVTGKNMKWPAADGGSCEKEPQIVDVVR